jgi:LemA protein
MNGLPPVLASSLLIGLSVGAVVLVGVPLVWAISVYNALRRQQVRAKNAFSQIDVQLKRRFDLIPSLVETVKGAMAHERTTLEAVIAARSQAVGALGAATGATGGAMLGVSAISNLSSASNALDGALGRLIGLVESYPELKANQNALRLQEELVGTENRIAFARQAYNDAVMRLNEQIVVFPSSLVAGALGIGEMGLFEAQAGERASVGVKF